jgi:hypothetical protein
MRSANRSYRRLKRFGFVVGIVCVLLAVGAGGATAATNTSVSATAQNGTASVGETVTFDIAVADVENGISSYEFDAELSDSSVAEIRSVSLQGTSAGDTLTTVDRSDDNSSVSVAAGAAGHDEGRIASITVETAATGTTNLSLSGVAIGDAGGDSYTIDSTTPGSLQVQGESTDVVVQPATRTVATDNLATVRIVAPGADSGVGSYEFNVSIADPSAATIEDVMPVGASDSDSLTDIAVSEDGSTASVTVGDGSADDGRIATVQLRGQAVGSTALSIENAELGDSNGASYLVSETGSSTIQVQAPPESVVGDNSPTDSDQDGTYEDVNGDGEFNIVDVNAVFQNRDESSIQNSEGFYDYNGDGEFTIVDINALLRQSSNSSSG